MSGISRTSFVSTGRKELDKAFGGAAHREPARASLDKVSNTEPPRAGAPTTGRPRGGDDMSRDGSLGARETHVLSSRNSFLPARSALEALKVNAVTLMEMRLEASPQMLDPTRAFVSSYVERRFHSRTAERVALACHELLENAVSYGSVSSDVVFALVQSGQIIEVRVSNKASPGRQSMLRKHMEKLKVDPEKTFLEEMARSVSASGARAMLGLARVCHEAKMDLEISLDGPTITTIARCGR
ncbi:MAG TPA: hypothetical protein VFQ61_34295 [Polyangiaceae bacterium]|nr:hypothetical protein [Polyangiaceae bacterium]